MSDSAIATLPERPEPAEKKPRRPRVFRCRTHEQLERAEYLRPAEIRMLYGISESTLRNYTSDLSAEMRLPRAKIRGVKGRRGVTLVRHCTLRAWLRWQEWCSSVVEPSQMEEEAYRSFPAWQAREAAATGRDA